LPSSSSTAKQLLYRCAIGKELQAENGEDEDEDEPDEL
jgi:hypothetical protein